MSERGLKFVNDWTSQHIQATGYEPEGDQSEAASLAEQCLVMAEAKGISKREIEDETGNLVDYMSQAIEEANDAEVNRLARKDD